MFGAIMDINPSPLQDILIVRGLICILESAPAADVVDQHYSEAVPACLNIVEKSLESWSVCQLQATLTEV
jgi:hypothetical protein